MSRFHHTLIALFCALGSCAYSQRQADSLIALAKTLPDSVERCKKYLEISQFLRRSDSLRAALYQQKAVAVAARISNPKKSLQAQLVLAKHYLNERSFVKARQYTERARQLASASNTGELATTSYYSGCIYLQEGETTKALDQFMTAYKLAAMAHDPELQAHVNASFGVVYQQQNQLDSALAYYLKSYAYFEKSNNDYTMAGSQNIGNILLSRGAYAEGQSYLNRALEIAKQRGDLQAEMIILGNIANGYEREGKLDLAERYARELIKDAEQTGFALQVMYGKTLLSTIKIDQQHYDEAIGSAREALFMAEQEKASSFVVANYEMLVLCYERKGDYRQAYGYKDRLVRLKDSLSAAANKSYIEEIKQRYNLQQKNQELQLKSELIEQIKTSDRQKTVIIASLLILGLSGLVSVFLFLQRRKIREELARKNLSIENQNKNLEAFIKGQEEERKRVASDLHDGLAQHLVMLKMGIQGLPLADDQQHHLGQEIDTMIEETRKISHNMMPGVLVDLGLLKALKSLVKDLNSHHPQLHVSLETNPDFKALAPDTEIQLYRIVQELLNNILKHSGASTCSISIYSTAEELRIQVSDNGKGFDTKSPGSGIGLQNIASRVASLRGSLQVNSVPGQGTSTNIHILLS